MITREHTKEALCLAHIYATAAVAGVNFSAQVFDYGVDGSFETVVKQRWGWVPSGFSLKYQAKASVDWTAAEDEIVYDLDARAYNNIVSRSAGAERLILILLCLPRDEAGWHRSSPAETVLRNCCYWHVFEGHPTPNAESKRIRIPASQHFTPDTLNALLQVERERRER